MKKRWLSYAIIIILLFIFYISLCEFEKEECIKEDTVDVDECGGFIATGSVCKDARSLFLKNRYSGKPGTMKPFFYQGNNYSFIAFGTYQKNEGRPYCRMGINEKGLAVGNFDQSGYISDGNWEFTSDHSSENEDYDMWYILGNFETVKQAAYWLVHHAEYPCEWGIISQEKGVGAIVAMDANYHGNISWINNSYAALGNQLYCEQHMNAQMKRTQYLADQIYVYGYGVDNLSSTVFTIKDISLLLSKDINASNITHPMLQEPQPKIFSGHYNIGGNGSICTTSSTSCMIAVSGDARFNGSLNLALFTSGYNPHVGVFIPIGASYLMSQDDVPPILKDGVGLQFFTQMAQLYAEDQQGQYNRTKTHMIHNCTDFQERGIIDAYEDILESVMITDTEEEIKEQLKDFCNDCMYETLACYRDLFIETIILVIPGESFWCNNVCYLFNKSLKFYRLENQIDEMIFNSTSCVITAPTQVNFTLMYLTSEVNSTALEDLLMEFYAETVDGSVQFQFTGFQPNCMYRLIIDNQTQMIKATSTGTLSFFLFEWGKKHIQIKTISFTNQPPGAIFTYQPQNPAEGDIITFTASESFDDDEIVQYTWDFTNDGIIDRQGEIIHHDFSKSGTFSVNLTVYDTFGEKAWLVKSITVSQRKEPSGSKQIPSSSEKKNIPPIADTSEGEPYQASIKEIIEFDGSASYDSDGSIIVYKWDFGDGSKAEGMITQHAYINQGSYTVILTVIDDAGAMNTITTNAMIFQQNIPPLKPVILGKTNLESNMDYTYTIQSEDLDDNALTYMIDWGDGSQHIETILNNASLVISHTWKQYGVFQIQVNVKDTAMATSETSTITIFVGITPIYINKEITGYIAESPKNSSIWFHNNATGINCNVTKQASGLYLIDSDNDDSWKFQYDPINGLTFYNKPDFKQTSGFEFILVCLCLLLLLISYNTKQKQ